MATQRPASSASEDSRQLPWAGWLPSWLGGFAGGGRGAGVTGKTLHAGGSRSSMCRGLTQRRACSSGSLQGRHA